MAFYNYYPTKGFSGSPFIGWQNFITLFHMADFGRQVYNTVIINVYKMVFSFPAPIIFAILITEVRQRYFKRTVQTISYLPHFVSWVVVSSLLYALINGNYGTINMAMKSIGITPPKWYVRPDLWRAILVVTEVWKNIGFGSILYLAAIAGINHEMYEAAAIDGASRFKQIFHIMLPCLVPTIIIMLIMSMGGMMHGNFQHVFALVGGNTPLFSTVDVLDTSIYRLGLQQNQFSLGTAMGIFQSVISFILVIITNQIANKVGEYGIW
jgi:putative aldouronate transport system permease protein